MLFCDYQLAQMPIKNIRKQKLSDDVKKDSVMSLIFVFAWGYDESRYQHMDHWISFKQQLKDWCNL